MSEAADIAPVAPVRWGVMGTAKIAVTKVIPAMRTAALCEVVALASRDEDRARRTARELDVPRAHGSYEALLQDPEVEAVYIPLPNHLHVPWAVRAAEAGKHVLCEKPIGLDADDARRLLEVRERTGVIITEAFMVRTHPQWLEVRDRVRSGAIGELRLVSCLFSYFKDDPTDIRNRREWGGGGLLDIGCYAVHIARWLFDREPRRVVALIDRDARSQVDILTSGMLDFEQGHASFTVGTRLSPYQRVQVFGTRGRIEVQIPFNTPPDRPCRIFLDTEGDLHGRGIQEIAFDTVDQYATQGDAVARSIRGLGPPPVPLEDSIGNMQAIDALVRSEQSGRWEEPEHE